MLIAGGMLFGVTADAQDLVSKSLQVVSFKPVGGENRFFWNSGEKQKDADLPEIRVSSNTLLPPVDYRGPKTLTLMHRADGGELLPAARVNLPERGRRTIVVLLPAQKEAKLPYRALALNGDLDVFKAGTRKVLNLSSYPVRGEMGANPFQRGSSKNVRFVCQAQKMVTVPVLNSQAKVLASQPVILEYYGANKKWNTLSSTRWFHTPTQRHLIFVFFDANRRNLILRGISDTVAADTRDIAANRAPKQKEDEDARKGQTEKKKSGPRENPRHQ